MTAREKIQGLTNSWYGFALCSGVLSFVQRGIGVFSILTALASIGFMFILTWFIGNRLLAKSSITRVLLLVITSLASIGWTYGTAKMGLMFLHEFSLTLIFGMLFGATSVYMHVRSFRVLMDSSVKTYISST